MDRKKLALEIIERLKTEYPDAVCSLDYDQAWKLLVSVRLAAQCTDARVNMVTEDLFKKYPSIKAFAEADLSELEQDIRSTGFYHNKAKNIIGCCQMLLSEYGGEVPSDIDKLTKLPGVGRKTANVIRGNIFGIDSIVVDTHVKRISNMLGFTDSQDPVKIEFELMELLPRKNWIAYNTQVIAHGRNICIARRPKCDICFLAELCEHRCSELNKEI